MSRVKCLWRMLSLMRTPTDRHIGMKKRSPLVVFFSSRWSRYIMQDCRGSQKTHDQKHLAIFPAALPLARTANAATIAAELAIHIDAEKGSARVV